MGATNVIPLLLLLACALWVPGSKANLEGDALHALRRSLVDPGNVLQSWDPTLVDPCTWFHVTCDRHNHVTRVDLGNAKLSGSLVPDLKHLQYLQYLELYKNNIGGQIPEELGECKNLVSLDLYMNNFTGPIPKSLANLQSLAFVRLNDNQLNGPIPRELASIKSLKFVNLANNDFCGYIPSTGSFERLSLKGFENNPRLKGPELLGFDLPASNDGCN